MTFPGEFLLSTALSSLLTSAMEPLARTVSHASNSAIPNQTPQPSQLVSLRYHDAITQAQYLEFMRRYGYDQKGAEILFEDAEQRFGMPDLVNLKRRGLMPQKQYLKLALESGVTAERSEIAEKALAFYPQVGDLIRFAVREGYTPEIIERFKLDEDLPEKFLEEANKAGLSAEDATLFWRAHWELPSVQAGYEMLHRRIIKIDELELLLRTADVMPFWRDKLIAIAQTPYTRVDVRRMFQLGVLDTEGVLRAYKDIGYDEEHASKLTEFTIKDVMTEERDLTKAEITKLYSFNELTKEKASEMLAGLGYDVEEVNFILSTIELKQKTADTTEQIKSYTEQFVNNLIDEEAFREFLSHLSMKAEAMERTIRNAIIKKLKARQRLEKTDILTVFKKELIDRVEAKDRLIALNYNDTDAELLLNTVKIGEVKK